MISESIVVPVLDLMIGQIVLGQQGNRGTYMPVHSKLTVSSRPLDVAEAIFNQTGCKTLYLADIDSFAGARPNWLVYQELLNRGFRLCVDADWITNDRYETIVDQLESTDQFAVILSSETMSDPEQFQIFEKLTKQNLNTIFSLDLQAGQLIAKPGKLESAEPTELCQLAYQHGVRNMILLDLKKVGTLSGVESESTHQLFESLYQHYPDVDFCLGGGIRNIEDIRAMTALGCKHVLVASAIHECRFTPYDLLCLAEEGIELP